MSNHSVDKSNRLKEVMELVKNRKPYPRSVLLLEAQKGEFEFDGRYYRMVYKVSTYGGIQQHLTKHSKKYNESLRGLCFRSYDHEGVRAYLEDKTALIVDVWLYEQKTGLKLLDFPAELKQVDLKVVPEVQSYAIKKIEEVRAASNQKVEELSTIVEQQSIQIQKLSEEIEALKQVINSQNSGKPPRITKDLRQLSLFD
jgi:uncharacterized coiled-coil protein SlyX